MSEKFNAAFKRWFKDSVVANEDGSPMVVWHGTNEEFTVFTAGEFGFHFGSKAAAHMFGDPVPYYLSIQNAFIINKDLGDWKPEDLLRWLSSRVYHGPGTGIAESEKAIILREVANLRKKHAKVLDQDDDMVAQRQAVYTIGRPVRETFKAFGCDGIRYKNEGEGGVSWIAFDANQVKLAENDGSWDADDPDIRSNPDDEGRWGYMEIGHELNGVLWIWKNGKLEDSTQPKIMKQADPDKRYWYKGLPMHPGLWDEHTKYWRGRFDPSTGMISAVGPDFTPRTEKPPVALQNALYSRFGSLKFSRHNPGPKR